MKSQIIEFLKGLEGVKRPFIPAGYIAERLQVDANSIAFRRTLNRLVADKVVERTYAPSPLGVGRVAVYRMMRYEG